MDAALHNNVHVPDKCISPCTMSECVQIFQCILLGSFAHMISETHALHEAPSDLTHVIMIHTLHPEHLRLGPKW